MTLLANAVDPARFDVPAEEGAAVRRELGPGPLVGFVGSLRPWHDVAGLVDALARLGPVARLVVVGDGPERERLQAHARRAGVDTVFTGAVRHERVPAYLAALDVAVAPYAASPGFYFSPLKLVEYLAGGVPVVAADVGDIGHCVRPGETGLLYPAGDASALAAAIRALLDDRPAARDLGRAGRAHALAEHTWERNARTVVELAGELRRAA